MSWTPGSGFIITGGRVVKTDEEKNNMVLESDQEVTVVKTNFKLVQT
jgi:hypothetical protein